MNKDERRPVPKTRKLPSFFTKSGEYDVNPAKKAIKKRSRIVISHN